MPAFCVYPSSRCVVRVVLLDAAHRPIESDDPCKHLRLGLGDAVLRLQRGAFGIEQREKVDDALTDDDRKVHGRIELGDGDEFLFRKRAGEKAIVTTDARHHFAFGFFAEELLGVDHEEAPCAAKPHVVQKRASGARGLPQLMHAREAGGAGVAVALAVPR